MTEYIPYTYRIYHRPTKMYYYGSKTSNNLRDIANPQAFWLKYFTSSKRVHQLIEEYGAHTFEIQHIKKFNTKVAARNWEAIFLQRIDAAHRPNWLNMHNCDKKFVNISHSEETKIKIGKSNTGKIVSEETRLKQSKNGKLLLGEKNPFFGKKHTEEAKKKNGLAHLGNTGRRGTTASEETKIKLRLSHLGKPSGNKGNHYSEEVKEKMRQSRILYLERKRNQ
jgi:hypothetical protein